MDQAVVAEVRGSRQVGHFSPRPTGPEEMATEVALGLRGLGFRGLGV